MKILTPTFLVIWIAVSIAPSAIAQKGKEIVYPGIQSQFMTRVLTGENKTIPGKLSTPYPTIHNLAIEWEIEGDDNLNGVVEVKYRKSGGENWMNAMPLTRVPAMAFTAGSKPNSSVLRWSNKHSGSILDLEADTDYEIVCSLNDPDGGEEERKVLVKTRPVPREMGGANYIPVTPKTFKETADNAKPGDVLILAPGHYGYYAALKDGEPGKPIVFRADTFDFRERDFTPEQKGHRTYVIFDGFSMQNRKHLHLEGILSTNTIDLFYAESCVVSKCIVSAIFGIVSGQQGMRNSSPDVYNRIQPSHDELLYAERETARTLIPPHSTNCYIADNIVLGVSAWLPAVIHAYGKNVGEGIQISGPGNIICHNKVIGFRDCISIMENSYAENQVCIDIYNNDIYSGADDGIEVDYIFNNCRIMRNRITNCMRGIAAAPVLGGPAYIIRNVIYNTEHIWQLGRIGSGYVALHNTSVKSGDAVRTEHHLHALVRNNIFLGGGEQAQAVVTSGTVYDYLDYDYNAYGVEGSSFKGTLAGVDFDSEKSLRENTMEKHGLQIGVKDFAEKISIPKSIFPEVLPVDLSLSAGSAAIDAGQLIPNINANFTGSAPDIGAYEFGMPIPHYGPRGLLDK